MKTRAIVLSLLLGALPLTAMSAPTLGEQEAFKAKLLVNIQKEAAKYQLNSEEFITARNRLSLLHAGKPLAGIRELASYPEYREAQGHAQRGEPLPPELGARVTALLNAQKAAEASYLGINVDVYNKFVQTQLNQFELEERLAGESAGPIVINVEDEHVVVLCNEACIRAARGPNASSTYTVYITGAATSAGVGNYQRFNVYIPSTDETIEYRQNTFSGARPTDPDQQICPVCKIQ